MTKPNIGTRLRWSAEAEVERLQDINADLLAALEFYADPEAYVAINSGKCAALIDRGKIANVAIAKAKGIKE